MKSVEFVKKFGWDWKVNYADYCVNINDLKTLVEAKNLLDLYGGLLDAKKCLLLATYAIDEDGSEWDSSYYDEYVKCANKNDGVDVIAYLVW